MRHVIAFAALCGLSSPLIAQVAKPVVDPATGMIMVPSKVCEINEDQEDTGSRLAKPKKSCKVVMKAAPKGAVLDQNSGNVYVPKKICGSSDPTSCTTQMVLYSESSAVHAR